MKNLSLFVLLGVAASGTVYANVSEPPRIPIGGAGITVNPGTSQAPITTGLLDATPLGNSPRALIYNVICSYQVPGGQIANPPMSVGVDRGDKYGLFMNSFSAAGGSQVGPYSVNLTAASGTIKMIVAADANNPAHPQIAFYNYDGNNAWEINNCYAQVSPQ